MMFRSLRIALPVVALLAAPALAGGASTLDEELRLNTSVTVTGNDITLGDLFQGYLSRPEKVVARAPRPGQHLTLTSEWLADTARTYGLNWKPVNAFDRAVVHQPGTTITPQDIVGAVKQALIASGMPRNYGIAATTQVAPVTVAASAHTGIDVREPMFDINNRTFSAVVQIPPGDPQAVFVPVRGTAFPVVSVPVLKEAVGKDTTITAAMIDMTDMPETQVQQFTLIDPNHLVGKTPKIFLRAGQPIRSTDVTTITLVDVPVLTTEMDRDGFITDANVKMVSVNAATLPADAVTSTDYLIGKSPRRHLAAGQPIRRADVQIVRMIEVPVAARDLPRGVTMTADDMTWVMMNEAQIVGEIAKGEDEIIGQTTRHSVRAGQPLRKHSLAKDVVVARGQVVTVIWSAAGMNLTATATAMEKASIGDVIRVTNIKSRQTMLVEVVDNRTARVVTQEAAAR